VAGWTAGTAEIASRAVQPVSIRCNHLLFNEPESKGTNTGGHLATGVNWTKLS